MHRQPKKTSVQKKIDFLAGANHPQPIPYLLVI